MANFEIRSVRRGGKMRPKDKVTIYRGRSRHRQGYARRFAEEGASRSSPISMATAAKRPRTQSRRQRSAWSRTTDVRSFPNVQGLIQETVKKFGRVDVLLNNAAIYVAQKLWRVRWKNSNWTNGVASSK